MALTAGTKLGPYEILSPLGAGGMGEVYRARDTRLDRSVAVKILPSHLSEDSEAKQRFDREARTISSLNHPNICTLHDVGHQDGVDYLVMEYLEGQTLADRLGKGPLPVEQVLRYGIEICDGLEKAHRCGVVHRDLKPGNIMLTKTGAKLMDFGLAKASVANAAAASGLTANLSSPPGSHPLTAQGTVVGTFQYMSPEQIEGKEADARSDIFALGAVLYEMVTGKRAFEGKTAATVMAAVLEREPAPISSMQPTTPPALERLVRTCLSKDPDERWQTAHDVKLQLKQIADGVSQVSAPAMTVAPRKRRNGLAWGVAAVLAAIAASTLFLLYQANQKQLPTLRVEINPPDKMQFNLSGDHSGPAMISPDGRYIVFSAYGSQGAQLYQRSLDTTSPEALPGTEGATFPFWSPDSRSIAFFTDDKLKRIEVSGGTPVTICSSTLGRGGSWNQDGTIVAALSYNTGISRVPASGGTPTPVTTADGTVYSSHRWPWFLPDGKHFLYIAVKHNAPNSPETAVFLASLDGKENRLLFHSLSNAIYASGRVLYQRENSLVAQPFDPSSGKFSGEAQTLSENVQFDAGLWRTNLSASTDGVLLYASGTTTGTEILTWYDRSGKRLGTVGEQGEFYDLDLSPDEKKIVTTDLNTATATIWVRDLTSNLKTRLTFSGGAHLTPVWSPDGKEVAFTSNQQTAISVKTLGSSAPERTLLSSPTPIYQAISDWSQDGRYLMYEQGAGMNTELWVLPLSGNAKPFPYATGWSSRGAFSPDGHWVAYVAQEGGRPEVFVAPFPWTGAKWQISNGGGAGPRWRGDGKELFYFDLNGITAVEVNGAGSTFEVGSSKLLFRLPLRGIIGREYSPTRDGQRFIAVMPSEGSSQTLTLFQNWPAELKK
ncbi:MAG: protein kinase domain-containing protein [Candidatus Korobacteraceae bacterium]|jgi:serine/threonine protein kinase